MPTVQKIRTNQIQSNTITKDLLNSNVAGLGVMLDATSNSITVKAAANSGIVVGGSGVYIDYYKDTPTGTADGTNVTFTLSYTPVSGSEMVYLNGLLQESGGGNDYTISTKTVTFVAPPYNGDKVRAAYIVASRT
jgi:hypothetical protein